MRNQPLLEYLLSKGADPNHVKMYGNVLLEFCEDHTIIDTLLYYGANVKYANVLHRMVSRKSTEDCIREMEWALKTTGVDINARAVHCAQCPKPCTNDEHKSTAIAKIGYGGTALHWAVRGYGFRQLDKTCRLPRVKWLLNHGADRGIADDEGKKAIDYADDPGMRQLLEEYEPLG